MICSVRSMGLQGVSGSPVYAECYISTGLPAFEIVGLPDTAVKEARERVRAAVKNSGFKFPVSRITVNLAPAGIKKSGTLYDLPILLGILAASGVVPAPGQDCAFLGELSLEGKLRSVPGVLPMALAAAEEGITTLYVPKENGAEASLAGNLTVIPVETVAQLVALDPGGGAGASAGFQGRDGPGKCETGPGGGGGRRPQCAAHRAARLGKEHAV